MTRPADAREPDGAPYGATLAEAVADALARGHVLAYNHRDYCGMGLQYVLEGAPLWSASFEKVAAPATEYRYGPFTDGELVESAGSRRFASRADFVAWLAAQSDRSLHGLDEVDPFFVGNQRLTRSRLEEFVASHPRR